MATTAAYREVGEAAWSWVVSQVREGNGPWLPESVAQEAPQQEPAQDRDSLYAGIAGLAPVLAEIELYRPLDREERGLAGRVVARLAAMAPKRVEPSLFDGLAGDVMAQRLLCPGAEQAALGRLRDLMTPSGWPSTIELVPGSDAPVRDLALGTAGVVLTAVWAGGQHAATIATTGGESLLRAADVTDAGLDWAMVPGWARRMPNYSHGTAGVATALAIAGTALGRADFLEAARLGAEHVVAVGCLDERGFVVPHTIPRSPRPVDPVTYTWCHGPAGTSYLFAALAYAGVTEVAGSPTTRLRQACLDAILSSGVPQRLRPGFWDNDGRCCGTAGVGDVLLDAAQNCPDSTRAGSLLEAARTMGDALVQRAVVDQSGARWQFLEHRQDPPLLPPGTSWMQGAAGIAAYLLRLTRVLEDGLGAPVVDRPDQWWAVPTDVRTVHTATEGAPPLTI